MRSASALLAAALALLPVAAAGQADSAPPSDLIERADEAMSRRSADAYAEAIELYGEARRARPDDTELKLKHAQALVGFMRSTTGANLPLADGTTADTPENREIWSRYAPEAVRLAGDVVQARPRSRVARAVHLEALTYELSSSGILQSFFSGAANRFRQAAEALARLDPSFEAAMGLSLLSGFYLVAPPPVGDLSQARAYAERAVRQSPDTSLPRYFLGVTALQQGDTETARRAFRWVVVHDCAPESARDYCSTIKRQSRRGLDLAAGG